MEEIARREGVDRKTVYNVARRAGLPNRHRFDAARTDRILTDYEAGMPVTKIATREGVERSYVRAVAKRAGMPPRKGWQRRYPLKEDAFDEPDDVGWWLIGLLAADGSISRRSNHVSLTQREADADVLHKFLAYMGCPERPLIELKFNQNAPIQRSRAFVAQVGSAQVQRALARHGVVPGKTKTLRLSAEAAAKPAVWLGLLDGDGWVSKDGQRGRPLIDFCGTPAVMRQCSEFWGARLCFQRVSAPTIRSHRSGLGRVALHGANAVIGAEILLGGSPISLERKRRTLEAIVAAES